MEWVETTGRSIDEAKNRALDQLGVAEDDAEFDVLEEPRAGLFGRMRGEARVRARVRPTQPRPKLDRRDRKKKTEGDRGAAASSTAVAVTADERDDVAAAAPKVRAPRAARKTATSAPKTAAEAAALLLADEFASDEADTAGSNVARHAASDESPSSASPGGSRRRGRGTSTPRPEAAEEKQEMDVDAAQVGEEARKFVEGLVTAFGLEGTTSVRQDGDDLEVSVDGGDLGLLVGPRGVTLQAIQELARVSSQRRLGDHETRLRVDVSGYRERRREALTRFAQQVAADVISSDTARSLEPMSSADRKVIHDALSEHEGVVTRSEGEDPGRRVVIAPATV